MIFWGFSNFIFVQLIDYVNVLRSDDGKPKRETINDEPIGFLEIFAAFIAFIVSFKTFFGAISILRFKCRFKCCKKYKVAEIDLKEEVKRLKFNTPDWNESLLIGEEEDP